MIKEMLIFVGGACAGFAAGTIVMRDVYKRMVDEEVQSVIDWANSKAKEEYKKSDKKTEVSHGESIKKVEELSREYKSGDESVKDDGIKPYCISAEEYEEDNGHEKLSLDYYLESEELYDGELQIKNIDEAVGSDNLVRLHGDLENVYVRNEDLKIDYEVVGIQGRFGVY